MTDYFVSCASQDRGDYVVHDRSRCPPGRFGATGQAEYMGDFLDATQALVVARVRYARVGPCSCCEEHLVHASEPARELYALTPLRP